MRKGPSPLIILLIYGGILFTAFLGALPADIMEARNFVTAQEMVEYNNWLIPTMNGELRLTKPPLPTWITAVWGMVFGFQSIAVLRLPAALIGMVLLFFLYKLILIYSKDEEQALMGGMVAASSFYLFLMSRTGSWDIFCHAFMLMAIYCVVQSFSRYFKSKLLLWAGVFMGLSFLSKGPIAFYALLLPFLIAYCIVYRFKDFRVVGWRWVLLLSPLILISFAWPFYTYLFVPEEAIVVASKESTNWLNYNVRPIYHYWSFPIQAGIWVLILVVSLAYPFMAKRVKELPSYRLAFFWTIFSVVLLSLIPEKKERYLLPVLIPAAWTMSFYYQVLRDALKRNATDLWVWQVNKGLLILISFLIAGFGMYLMIGGGDSLFNGRAPFSTPLCLVISFCFLAVGVYTFRSKFVESAEQLFHAPLLIMLFATLLVLPKLGDTFFKNDNYKSPVSLLESNQFKELSYFTTHESLRIEMIWEARKRIAYQDPAELHLVEEKIGVFSTQPLINLLTGQQREQLEIREIERFNINRYPRNSKRYTSELDQYFSIVSPK